jgi:hypothetical protein
MVLNTLLAKQIGISSKPPLAVIPRGNLRSICIDNRGCIENKNDHGDTESTELHGEKEEREPVKDFSPSPPCNSVRSVSPWLPFSLLQPYLSIHILRRFPSGMAVREEA